MITVSHREGPDPNGADPLAADEPVPGFRPLGINAPPVFA
jgi:hypothetical protein